MAGLQRYRRRLQVSDSALDIQVGGGHYKSYAIQPVEFIHKNKIPYIEGCAIKYLCRWREKGGVEDLKKARHYLDLLIEMEMEMEENQVTSREQVVGYIKEAIKDVAYETHRVSKIAQTLYDAGYRKVEP
jgi:hypothetical protein